MSNRKPPVRKGFSSRELLFVRFFAIEGKPKVESARLAGYSKPEVVASRLTDPIKSPKLCLAIQKERDKNVALYRFKADDIQRFLEVGVFLDYRLWFEPGSIDGKYWLISEEKYREMPMDVARHIRYAEREVTFEEEVDEEGNVTGVVSAKPTGMLKIRMLEKEQLVTLLSKHMLGEKVNHTGSVVQLNWSDLQKIASMKDRPPIHDPIEAEILSIKDKGVDLLASGVTTQESSMLPVPISIPSKSE